MALDPTGSLLVADRLNHRIRKITPAGEVSTIAGNGVPGHVDGSPLAAQFNEPSGLGFDRNGNLYVSERFYLRRIGAAGQVATVAGLGQDGFVDGPGTSAQFSVLSDLSVDALGNVYLSDFGNSAVRKVTLHSGEASVSTIAGRKESVPQSRDGIGHDARFLTPNDVEVDGRGNVWVSDAAGHCVRRITTVVPLTMNGSNVGGRLAGSADEDWFEFVVDEVGHPAICLEVGSGTLPDPLLQLYGPDNPYSLLAQDDNSGLGEYPRLTLQLAQGRYQVRIVAGSNSTRRHGSYTMRATSLTNRPRPNGPAVWGHIDSQGDNDWFEFDLSETGQYVIESGSGAGAGNDLNRICMYLYSSGNMLREIPVQLLGSAQSDPSGVPVRLAQSLVAGKYWIRVRAQDPVATGHYILKITRSGT